MRVMQSAEASADKYSKRVGLLVRSFVMKAKPEPSSIYAPDVVRT